MQLKYHQTPSFSGDRHTRDNFIVTFSAEGLDAPRIAPPVFHHATCPET